MTNSLNIPIRSPVMGQKFQIRMAPKISLFGTSEFIIMGKLWQESCFIAFQVLPLETSGVMKIVMKISKELWTWSKLWSVSARAPDVSFYIPILRRRPRWQQCYETSKLGNSKHSIDYEHCTTLCGQWTVIFTDSLQFHFCGSYEQKLWSRHPAKIVEVCRAS